MSIVPTKSAPPRRVQLSRKRGWRMPSKTASVARPGPWGNPFRVGGPSPDGGTIATRDEAVALYRVHVVDPPLGRRWDELRGLNLACWCPLDGPCHAEVLLERANAPVANDPARASARR